MQHTVLTHQTTEKNATANVQTPDAGTTGNTTDSIKTLARRLSRSPRQQQNSKRGRKVILWIVLLGSVAAAVYLWQITRPTPVEIAIVSYQRAGAAATPILRQSGYVTFPRTVTVSSTSAGVLQQVFVQEGDQVEQGQLLASFEHAALTAQKNVYKTQMNDAELTLERLRSMHAAGAASAVELQQAETAHSAARAQLELAETGIAASFVRAPFAGRILNVLAQVGERAPAGICQLADTSNTLVAFDISQEDLHLVDEDQPALVVFDAYPDIEYAGRLYRIHTTADRTTNSIHAAVALLEPDARILPNMSARVYLVHTPQLHNAPVQSVLAVEQSAVAQDEAGPFVWYIENNLVSKKRITPGADLGEGGIEIVGGLRADDIVVKQPATYTFSEGDRVIATH